MRVIGGAILYRFNKKKLEVLLVHQRNKHKNLWSIPKGGADKGETFEQTARRELYEETNIKADILEFLGYVDYGSGTDKRFYCLMGQCPENYVLQARMPEIDKAAFFDVGDAKKMVDKRQRPLINAMQKIIAVGMPQLTKV